MDDGTTDAKSLFHASRKTLDKIVSFILQTNLVENLIHPLDTNGGRQFISPGKVIEVLPSGQILIDRKKVGEVTHFKKHLFGRLLNVNPIDVDLPRCRLQ